jgi:CheY-like chemotaxis protein
VQDKTIELLPVISASRSGAASGLTGDATATATLPHTASTASMAAEISSALAAEKGAHPLVQYYDLILMDIVMARSDGANVTHALRLR